LFGQCSTFAAVPDYTGIRGFVCGFIASKNRIDMTNDSSHYSSVFRIDVSADPTNSPMVHGDVGLALVTLMRHMIVLQEKQNQMLEQLVQNASQMQRARTSELQQWKDANPHLARSCRNAAETLAKVQTQFLENMTEEITDNEESLLDGEFMLNEFVDRYGPRMAHLNGVLQMLAQLGSGVPGQPV
jgi:predicted DsbA family dithiol-disulfide isomerase